MRSVFLACLALAATCALSPVAHADSITFVSAPGIAYSAPSGSGTAVAFPNSGYGQPAAGSQWISTSAYGGYGLFEATTYTTTFTLLANQLYTGTISFMADDYATLAINGNTIFTGGNYTSLTTVALLPTYFRAGTNTFTIQDFNSGGGAAGVDFAASLTGTAVSSAVTPEPSSLILIGSGMLCGAITLARRRSSNGAKAATEASS